MNLYNMNLVRCNRPAYVFVSDSAVQNHYTLLTDPGVADWLRRQGTQVWSFQDARTYGRMSMYRLDVDWNAAENRPTRPCPGNATG